MPSLLPDREEKTPLESNLINGVPDGTLVTGSGGDASITITNAFAGYANTLGAYLIGEDGTIGETRVLVTDTTKSAPGDRVSLSDAFGSESLAPGQAFGLFLIADGADRNKAVSLEEGTALSFIDKRTGEAATLDTPAWKIRLVDPESGRTLKGKVYHTAGGDDAPQGENALNKDGDEHTISAVDEETGVVSVAFEDKNDFDLDDLEIAIDLSAGAPVIDPGPLPPKELELDEIAGGKGVRIDGIEGGERAGLSVAMIGDVNGDGLDDMAVGAPLASPEGRAGAGAVYVVYGTEEGFPDVIPATTLDGANGFIIEGASVGDHLGHAVAAAGDVDGDGIDDLIIGANGFDGAAGIETGAAVIVFGDDARTGATLDLASLAPADGVVIEGLAANDDTGVAVSGGGDINGDGFDDVVIGARLGEADYARYNGGMNYVLFGGAGGPETDLGALDGSNGFTVEGRAFVDQAGRDVAILGDVNGDGIDDLAIGAPDADPNGRENAGEAYIVFGTDAGFDSVLDPGDLDGTNGFIIEGESAGNFAGFAIEDGGDINGDGLADIIVGAYAAPHPGVGPDGGGYVVFGRDDGFGATLDLGDLTGDDGFQVLARANGDGVGRAVSGVGDVTGDGFDDFLVGARYADPSGADGGGEVYLVFGREGFDSVLDVDVLQPDEGCILLGYRTDGYVGFSVAGTGDVDGDGFDDMLMGEPFDVAASDPGSAYLVFGGAGLQPGFVTAGAGAPAIETMLADMQIV